MSLSTQHPNWGQVDSAGHGAPAIAFMDGVTVPSSGTELADPSAFDQIRWMPIGKIIYSKDANRTAYNYRVGFRLVAQFTWGYLTKSQRETIIGFVNLNTAGAIRLWPHSDKTSVYYDMIFDPQTNVDHYLHKRPLGYTGTVYLVGQRKFNKIPITGTKYHFCDDSEGSYTTSDELAYFSSSSAVYTDEDEEVSFFNGGQ